MDNWETTTTCHDQVPLQSDIDKWAADSLVKLLNPVQERRKKVEDNPRLAWDILEAGSEQARKTTAEAMAQVREAMSMSLNYEAPKLAEAK